VFMGEYSSTTTYIGSGDIIMMVKEGTLYYMTMPASGTFSNISPSANVSAGDGTTGTKWKKFSGSFKSVATELLLSEEALIAGWKFKDGVLMSQGGAGIAILDGRATSSDGDDPSNTDPRIAIGNPFATRRTAPFRVYEDGVLYASDVHLSGEVTATSGRIGGFVVYNDTVTGVRALKSSNEAGGAPAYIEMLSATTAIHLGGKKNATGDDYDSMYSNNITLARLVSYRGRVNPPNENTINTDWIANVALRLEASREAVSDTLYFISGAAPGIGIEFVPVTAGIGIHSLGGAYIQGNCLFTKYSIRVDAAAGATRTWNPTASYRYFMVTDTFLFLARAELRVILPEANTVINSIDERVSNNAPGGGSTGDPSDDNFYGGATEYTFVNKGENGSYNSADSPTARTQSGSNNSVVIRSASSSSPIFKGGAKLATTEGIVLLPGEVLKMTCTQNAWYVSGGYGVFTTRTGL
jgi:hypothetical protein